MGGTLVFPINDDLKRIVEHAEQNDPALFYGETIERSVFWVKDHGTYLMSGGNPGLLKDPAAGNSRQLVVYAEGHNPDTGDYDYDFTRQVCGGDDFGEPIGVAWFRKMIDAGCTQIIFKVDGAQFELEAR